MKSYIRISDEDLNTLLDRQINGLKKVIALGCENIYPTLHIAGWSFAEEDMDYASMVITSVGDPTKLAECFIGMGKQYIKRSGRVPLAISFLAKAKIKLMTPAEAMRWKASPEPATAFPDARSVIQIIALTSLGKIRTVTFDLNVDDHGIFYLGKQEGPEDVEGGSTDTFLNAFYRGVAEGGLEIIHDGGS